MAPSRPTACWNWAAIPRTCSWCARRNAGRCAVAPPLTFWPARMWARCCWKFPACPDAWTWWPAAGWRLLAEESGVTLFLLREGAQPEPSAAATRWQVRKRAVRSPMTTTGAIRFSTRSLIRHRLGGLGRFSSCTWDREHGLFPTTRRRYLALWLPRLPTDRLIRRANGAPFQTRAPLVVSRTRQQRAVCPRAGSAARSSWVFIKASPWPMPAPWCEPLAVVPADERADAGAAGRHRRLVRPLHAAGRRWIRRTACFSTSPARRICSAAKPRCSTHVTTKIAAQGFAVHGRHCRHVAGGAGPGALRQSAASRRPAAKHRAMIAPLPIAALDCGDDRSARPASCRPQDHRPGGGTRPRSELTERLGTALSSPG